MFRIFLIGLPVLYLLGVCTLATIYLTVYANTGIAGALVYGIKWPVVALETVGVL